MALCVTTSISKAFVFLYFRCHPTPSLFFLFSVHQFLSFGELTLILFGLMHYSSAVYEILFATCQFDIFQNVFVSKWLHIVIYKYHLPRIYVTWNLLFSLKIYEKRVRKFFLFSMLLVYVSLRNDSADSFWYSLFGMENDNLFFF